MLLAIGVVRDIGGLCPGRRVAVVGRGRWKVHLGFPGKLDVVGAGDQRQMGGEAAPELGREHFVGEDVLFAIVKYGLICECSM